MRHKLDIPTIIDPRQRVPELTFTIDRKKIIRFIEDNAQLLADFLNISRLPVEGLRKYLDHDFLVSISRFDSEHQRQQIVQEASDKVWSQHLKPLLITAIYDDIIEQAINYTHEQHVHEIPFEEGRESRARLMDLVAGAFTVERLASHPVQVAAGTRGRCLIVE